MSALVIAGLGFSSLSAIYSGVYFVVFNIDKRLGFMVEKIINSKPFRL